MLLAKQTEEFLSESEIVCDKCQNHIFLMRQEVDEDMIKEVEGKIKKINVDFDRYNKEIEAQKDNKKSLVEKIKTLKRQMQIDEQSLADINNTIHEYDVFIKMKELFVQKKEKKFRADIQLNYNEIETDFEKFIRSICINVANRLRQWGLKKYITVNFNFDRFDLVFDDTLRTFLPKGYKSLCTNAFIIELILYMKSINVPCFDFILIDTLWCVSFIKDYHKEDLMTNIILNLIDLDLQVIILENTHPLNENKNSKYLQI